jgi:glucose 1-dehydrogenase
MYRPNLRGSVAVVTGAGRGIGRAIALRLASAGAAVGVAARTEGEIDETRRQIEKAGGRAVAIVADVTKERDVTRLFDQARAAFGRIGILVNNAGIAPLANIEEMTPESFDAIIASNIRAVYLCCRAAWSDLAKGARGSGTDQVGGAVINISSVASFDPFPGFAAYGGAKAFVNVYTKALAAEGAARGIRVFAIAPGAVETTMLRNPFPDFPADKTLSPDDVAALVETLLSPACRYISGQTITIKKE